MKNRIVIITGIGTGVIIIGLILTVIFINTLTETFVGLLMTWLLLIFIVIIYRLNIKSEIKIITVIIVFFFVIMLNGYMQANWFITPHKDPSPIVFRQENNTLIVTEVKQNLIWDDFVIIRGNATLPTGTVNQGDIITDCIGTSPYGGIFVQWLPSKTMLYWGKNFPIEYSNIHPSEE